MEARKMAICDKDQNSLAYYSKEIERGFFKYWMRVECRMFSDPEKLFETVRMGEEYELYFLDFSIPKISAPELAERILKEQPESPIVFSSVRENDIFKTFHVQPFGFIRKQKMSEDIEKVIWEYASWCAKYEKQIYRNR
ncbi:MAG: response regulator [Lachnospiraceae bacterium]|nr:response regulator [Robinsoniella sp.]MDY3767353.1 response regulator [Lachnospiraceae bacterium]